MRTESDACIIARPEQRLHDGLATLIAAFYLASLHARHGNSTDPSRAHSTVSEAPVQREFFHEDSCRPQTSRQLQPMRQNPDDYTNYAYRPRAGRTDAIGRKSRASGHAPVRHPPGTRALGRSSRFRPRARPPRARHTSTWAFITLPAMRPSVTGSPRVNRPQRRASCHTPARRPPNAESLAYCGLDVRCQPPQ